MQLHAGAEEEFSLSDRLDNRLGFWAPHCQGASGALSLPFPARAAIAYSNVSYVPIGNPFLEAKKEAFWHTISPSGPWYKRLRSFVRELNARNGIPAWPSENAFIARVHRHRRLD
jgi:hypothetical protein